MICSWVPAVTTGTIFSCVPAHLPDSGPPPVRWLVPRLGARAYRKHALAVTIVEPLPVPLGRVLGNEIGQVFADLHREHGVDLRTSVQVSGVESGDGLAVVRLAARTDLAAVGRGAAGRTAGGHHGGRACRAEAI
mgnify:CR=1 FL=1